MGGIILNPHIKSNGRTNWSSNRDVVAQPSGLNYEQLQKSISDVDDKRNHSIKKESSVVRKDLRKLSSDDFIAKDVNENDEVNKLDQKSVIPIPGLMFEYLENTNGYSGKSNWTDTNNNSMSNGPSWNSYVNN